MCYKFTHFSTWPPGYLGALQKTSGLDDTRCSYKSYFLDSENDKICKKMSGFTLPWVEAVWNIWRPFLESAVVYTAIH